MMSRYDFDAYVHSIARREPRRLPACLLFSHRKSVLALQQKTRDVVNQQQQSFSHILK